jgi:hypothetical protein
MRAILKLFIRFIIFPKGGRENRKAFEAIFTGKFPHRS